MNTHTVFTVLVSVVLAIAAPLDAGQLRGGATAVDITPLRFPVSTQIGGSSTSRRRPSLCNTFQHSSGKATDRPSRSTAFVRLPRLSENCIRRPWSRRIGWLPEADRLTPPDRDVTGRARLAGVEVTDRRVDQLNRFIIKRRVHERVGPQADRHSAEGF